MQFQTFYEKVPDVPMVESSCVAINHMVNMSNGTAWHVQTTFYGDNLIGVAIDRKAFYLFRGDWKKTLTHPTGLDQLAEKLGLSESDAIGMQQYYNWLFKQSL